MLTILQKLRVSVAHFYHHGLLKPTPKKWKNGLHRVGWEFFFFL